MPNRNINFGKVAVLMGGRSAERAISLMSGEAVLKALISKGVNAHAIDPAEKNVFTLKSEKFDRCFIALHGRYGEDGTIQGALEIMGIPYTGSGVMASSIAMNKIMTKNIWQAKGLPTPSWYEAKSISDVELAFLKLNSTMIVKPALEGSSIGITKVTQLNQCKSAYELAMLQDSSIICEQYISGEEVTCTVLDTSIHTEASETSKEITAFPIIKIEAPSGKYDYQNKYFTNETKYIVPCGLITSEEKAVQNLAIEAFNVLGCRGWARLDVMIDSLTRKPYFLEINTAPGMTSHSLVPMAAKQYGLNFEMLCMQILATATLDYKTNYNIEL